MNEPVVVGVDGSDAAEHAAVWAANEAVRRGSPLVLVHIVRWPVYEHMYLPSPSVTMDEAPLRRWAATMLKSLADVCRAVHPAVEVNTRVEVGVPAEALTAVEPHAAMVVVGAAGAGRLTRLFLGSTAAELARHSKPPVVVVRETDTSGGHVVVGVDGSPTSARAVDFAFEFAARHHAELVAVHAWSDVPLDEALHGEPVDGGTALQHAQRSLDLAIAGAVRRWPDVSVRDVAAIERPANVLLEQAQGASLLVVGSHGRGALRRALLGSVSHTILHESPCPVAVLRAH
ncbi:universal stress protein [Lentzea sp. NEAU-D7]|uniref:universal stress protein n=1 Tax=Lentzea sp. NEAU-D7 TaxID=2994667 RepID=UPI00224B539C|nr:universal stress protein [Lentzea sp. NEAU-D7]MCX2948888.1 universal stress protein [Lentzea sp. NEAU-D7]